MVLQYGTTSWYYSMVLYHGTTVWYYIMVLQYGITSWYYSMVLHHGTTIWYYIMVLQYGTTSWYYSMVLYHGTGGVHRVGYKRSTRPDKISNKPEHDPIPERRKPDDPTVNYLTRPDMK